MSNKAKAKAKASIHNIIKIVLDQKKKRKTRRKKKSSRRTREQQQMEFLATLASKPPMREVKQPDPDKEQNTLLKSALLASNVGVIRALNNLNQPTFTTGYAPPQFPEAQTSLDETPPPETPAGKYAERVRVARRFLANNLEHIPTKRKYTASEIMDLAPTYVMNLATRTRKALEPDGTGALFMGEGEDDEE